MLIADLKRAIETSGLKLTQIAEGSGVSPAQLSRFVHGERGISLDAAGKLAEFFKLRLCPIEGGKRKG